MKKQLVVMFFKAVEVMGLTNAEIAFVLQITEEDVASLWVGWELLSKFPLGIGVQVVAIYAELAEKLRDGDITLWMRDFHKSLSIRPKYLLENADTRAKLLDYVKEMLK